MSFNPFSIGINRYSITDSYLNMRYAVFLFIFTLITGTIGFSLIENYSILEGFYMAVITISTVGYTEVKPLSQAGQVFASIYIILNIGIFAYAVAAFTKYIVYGEMFKYMHINMIQKKVSQLSDHVIICGYGRYGSEISRNLKNHNIEYVIIEKDDETVEAIQKSPDKLLYIHGDATNDEVLVNAGIKKCKALIAAMADDANNLFTVLTARQLNDKINIISRTKEERTEKKLRLAGANHTIMPEQIGGFYISNLVNRPDAVEFFNFLSEGTQVDVCFEELDLKNIPGKCHNLSIRELDVRKKTGANIIGYKDGKGNYKVNPDPDLKFEEGSSFIVIGTRKQIDTLIDYLDNY